jgi:hypothetical protein
MRFFCPASRALLLVLAQDALLGALLEHQRTANLNDNPICVHFVTNHLRIRDCTAW